MEEPHSPQLAVGGTPPFRFGLLTCGGDLRGVEVDGADEIIRACEVTPA
jgi:hypothetical protein